MIKTSTCLIANNAIYIKKDKSENGVIVFYEDNFVCVISTTKEINDAPVILLLREKDPELNVYEKWLHISGKMIKKDEKSKYFVQPINIHLTNGAFSYDIVKDAIKASKKMKKLYIQVESML